jgi:hypothetical protein
MCPRGATSSDDTKPGTPSRSYRSVPDDTRHPVEVGVVAGQIDDTSGLHERDQESVIGEQTVLNAQVSRHGDSLFGDQDDFQSEQGDLGERLTKAAELLEVLGMTSQAGGDALIGPAEYGAGFEGHQSVRHFRQDMRRCPTIELSMFKALQEPGASTAVDGLGREMVDEDVGIEENRIAGREVRERHDSAHG